MRSRWLLTSLAIGALVVAFIQQPATAGVVVGAAPQTLGTWSSPVRVLAGSSSGLSCSSPRFCTAVSYDGTAAQGHGRKWAAPQTVIPGTDNPYAVSCEPDGTCMVVTRQDQYAVYDGTSWSPAAVVLGLSGSFYGVSCLSATFCAAVTGDGGVAFYDGSSWTVTPVPKTKSLISISCTSPTFCAAVGYVFAFTWDGTTWSPAKIDRKTNLTSVSCASPTFCAASDEAGRAFEWDGASWSAGTKVIPGGGYPSKVSCPSATFCAMVAKPTGDVSTFDGTGWSSPMAIDDAALADISCPTTTFCTALDTKGFVLNLHRAA